MNTGKKRKTAILMHRVVMEMACMRPLKPDEIVDHIDHNRLNNCLSNLRIVTKHQNRLNSKKRADTTSSKYKGVSWHKVSRMWSARITVNKRIIYLGEFTTEKRAALEYNKAAKEYFGEHAYLNDIPTTQQVHIAQRSFEW